MSRVPFIVALALSAQLAVASAAAGATPASLAEDYARAAGPTYSPSAARGRELFTRRHGGDWSCSTCHTVDPRAAGRHTVTGRPIQPLAPEANPARLSDARKVEKWFTRNCRDVLQRECTPGEKADVIAWLSAPSRG